MNEEFSKRLKRLRDRKQIKQKVMGERCGLSKDIIGKYERGEREPSSSSLEKLADFFEMSMDELWRGRKNF